AGGRAGDGGGAPRVAAGGLSARQSWLVAPGAWGAERRRLRGGDRPRRASAEAAGQWERLALVSLSLPRRRRRRRQAGGGPALPRLERLPHRPGDDELWRL